MTLNLRVLSPSSEVDGGIHLQDLPTSTTVRELRLKIQDAVASKPGPERMRLIYRGKVVANDADTLETVFGAENVGHAMPFGTAYNASELINRPASRVQRPEPASGHTRTTADVLDILDIFHARPAYSDCPAQPSPTSCSWPSAPDEPLPRHTTTPSQLAATGRPAAAPSPSSSRTSPALPPSPPCATAPQPSGSRGGLAALAPDAAAACPGYGTASRYSSSRRASSRYTSTATATCVDRGRSSPTSPSSARHGSSIWWYASAKRQDSST